MCIHRCILTFFFVFCSLLLQDSFPVQTHSPLLPLKGCWETVLLTQLKESSSISLSVFLNLSTRHCGLVERKQMLTQQMEQLRRKQMKPQRIYNTTRMVVRVVCKHKKGGKDERTVQWEAKTKRNEQQPSFACKIQYETSTSNDF